MDVKCVHCGEPWDISELHEVAIDGDYEHLYSFEDAKNLFYKHGCGIWQRDPIENCDNDPVVGETELQAIGMLTEIFGHDIDGLCCDLEDMEMFDLGETRQSYSIPLSELIPDMNICQMWGLWCKFNQEPDGSPTFVHFMARATNHGDYLLLHWCNMWLGIEKDGYTHS